MNQPTTPPENAPKSLASAEGTPTPTPRTGISYHFEMLMPLEEQQRIGATEDRGDNMRVLRVLSEYEDMRQQLAAQSARLAAVGEELEGAKRAFNACHSELAGKIRELALAKECESRLLSALRSIATAPAFDSNSQTLVDLAQRTLRQQLAQCQAERDAKP